MKKSVLSGLVAAVVLALVVIYAEPVEAQKGRRRGQDIDLGAVYVISQGLYYDTFVTAEELPPHGRFQLLVDGKTMYGPGDPGYLGGRWKVPDGEGGYRYFLCPLLGPGRESP